MTEQIRLGLNYFMKYLFFVLLICFVSSLNTFAQTAQHQKLAPKIITTDKNLLLSPSGTLKSIKVSAGIGMNVSEVYSTQGHWLLKGEFVCEVGDNLFMKDNEDKTQPMKLLCCKKTSACKYIDHTY